MIKLVTSAVVAGLVEVEVARTIVGFIYSESFITVPLCLLHTVATDSV